MMLWPLFKFLCIVFFARTVVSFLQRSYRLGSKYNNGELRKNADDYIFKEYLPLINMETILKKSITRLSFEKLKFSYGSSDPMKSRWVEDFYNKNYASKSYDGMLNLLLSMNEERITVPTTFSSPDVKGSMLINPREIARSLIDAKVCGDMQNPI